MEIYQKANLRLHISQKRQSATTSQFPKIIEIHVVWMCFFYIIRPNISGDTRTPSNTCPYRKCNKIKIHPTLGAITTSRFVAHAQGLGDGMSDIYLKHNDASLFREPSVANGYLIIR